MEALDSAALAEEIRILSGPLPPQEKSRRMMNLFPRLLACLTVSHALRDQSVTKPVFDFVRSTINSPGPRAFAPELLVLFVALALEPQLQELAKRAATAASTLLIDGPEHDPAPETLRAFVQDSMILLEDVSQLCGACGLQPGVWQPTSDSIAPSPTLVLAFERLASLPSPPKRPPVLAVRLPILLDLSSLERAFRAVLYLLPLLTVALQRTPAVVGDVLSSAQAWEVSAFFVQHGPAVVREAALLLLEAQLRTAPPPPFQADAQAAALLGYLSVPAHDSTLRSKEADLVAARCMRHLFSGAALPAASLHALQATLPRLLPDNTQAPLELHDALVHAFTAALPYSPDLAAAMPRHLRPLFGPAALQRTLVACLRAAVTQTDGGADAKAANSNKRGRDENDASDSWPAVLDAVLGELERPEGNNRDWSKLLIAPDPAPSVALLCALAAAPPRAVLRKLRTPILSALVGGVSQPLSEPGSRALQMLLETAATLVRFAEEHGAAVSELHSSLLHIALSDNLIRSPEYLPAAPPLLTAVAPNAEHGLARRYATLLTTITVGDAPRNQPVLLSALQYMPLFYARIAPAYRPDAQSVLLAALTTFLSSPSAELSSPALEAALSCLSSLACIIAGAPSPASPTSMPVCACTSTTTDPALASAHSVLPVGLFSALITALCNALSRLSLLPAVPSAPRLLTHLSIKDALPLVELYAKSASLLALPGPADMTSWPEHISRLTLQGKAQAVALSWLGKGMRGDALKDAVGELYPLQFVEDPHIGGRAYDALRALQRAHSVRNLSVFLFSFAPLLAPALARDPGLLFADASTSLFDCSPVSFYRRTLSVSLPQLMKDADDPKLSEGTAEAQITRLVTQLAERNLRSTLLHYAPDILAQLLPLHCTAGAVDKRAASIQLLERLSGQSLAQLMELRVGTLEGEPDPPLLIVQLLIAMGRPNGQARRAAEALQFMAKTQADGSIAAVLHRDFFHMMLHFNTLLLADAHRPLASLLPPTEVLGGLEQLISHLSPDDAAAAATRVHVRTVLRYGLQEPTLRRAALACWHTYLHRLPSAAALGPQLAQLVADVLPALQSTDSASPALEVMRALYEKGANLAQLPFLLPDLPALRPLLGPHSPRPLPELLEQLRKSAHNEETDVRRAALDHIATVLRESREAVTLLVLDGSGVIAPSIVRLLEALLAATRDEDGVSREKAALCLGALGAIDPTREAGRTILRAATRRLPEEAKLACELLEGPLLKGLVAHAAAQARTAATIQRILAEVLHVSKEAPEKSDWWGRLSESTRHLVQPYLSTRYVLPPAMPDLRPARSCFARVTAFRDWSSEWTCRLIAVLPPDAPPLFRIVQPLCMRRDQELATAVLPSVALHIAQHKKHHSALVDEMNAVFTAAAHSDPPSPLAQRASETCFALLDGLNRWLEDKRAAHPHDVPATSPSRRAKQKAAKENAALEPAVEAVAAALAALSPLLIVAAARRCRAYPRALMQLEAHVRVSPPGTPLPHAELQRILGGLGDTDALAGLAALRGGAATQASEEAHDLENTGKWLDALQLYEAALSSAGHAAERLSLREGQVRCLAALDQLHTVLSVVSDAAAESVQGLSPGLRAAGMEAAWRLGRWDRLETLTSDPTALITPELCLGRALLALHRNEPAAVSSAVAEARHLLLEPLAAASCDSYVRAYPLLLQLHVLHDVQLASTPEVSLPIVLPARAVLAQPNHTTQERLLSVRSVLLAHKHLQGELGRTWLQLSKLARKNDNAPRAGAALARAREHGAEGAVLEEAKLLWSSGSHARAMRLLEAEEKRLLGAPAERHQKQHHGHGLEAVRLMTARWLQESGQRAPSDVIAKYKDAFNAGASKSEKAHFLLARYYDALLTAQRGGTRTPLGTARSTAALDAKQCTHLGDALTEYGEALKHGHKRLFHALPRMLTLWLDYAAAAAEQRKGDSGRKDSAQKQLDVAMAQANRIVKALITDLPAYVWLTALSQLLSRLLHRSVEVAELIRQAVVNVLHAHPQQTLWALQASLNATTRERQQRAKQIVDEALKQGKGPLPRLVDASRKLGEALIDLCNVPVPAKSKHISLNRDGRRLVAARGAATELLILPLQASLTPSLPPADRNSALPHAPFGVLPTFLKFKDDVEVLGSLQRPRKLFVEASDGKQYIFLCKPKDDLRRDARMMEFHTLVNKLMTEAAEARRRSLYIRTYGVVALNEECGLIEWVPHTQATRATILPLYGYPAEGTNELQRTIKNHLNATDVPKTVIFEKRLLPMFRPCVFHRWFLSSWPEPYSWLEARQRYTRSTALMSMVGAVIGLGDRHGENILLDAVTGDAVHVDFNCLFWKGKTFQAPERVPFRLTQNMVDAMGVLGVEGPFRRAAEVALTVLRTNRDSLMSVLETFVHDPAIDPGARDRDDKERDNPVSAMAEIERLLAGRLQEGVVLSVEGQVQQLIEEATSSENLAHMYIGWNAWI